jgi:hypothetical protein
MLIDNVKSIVGTKMEELKAPANMQFDFLSWSLDFVRDMQKDVKTLIPDRDKVMFIPLEKLGYNVVRLPGDYYEYLSIGTQIGHYVKGLAINNRLTDHKKQPNRPPIIDGSTNDNIWYWGGLYGAGMSWATNGAIDAYGNGGDYGDVSIDPEKRIMITSPTFRYKNITLRYYANCITPSEETCIHPWFIMPLKHWLNYWYYFYKGDSRWQVSKLEYEKAYLFAVQSKYRTNIPTIVKTLERIRGYRHA